MAKNKPMEFTDLTGHMILFSKWHYGRPEGVSVIERLADFIFKWSWTPKEYLPPSELYQVVAESFVEACGKRDILRFIKGVFRPIEVWRGDLKQLDVVSAIESILGIMSVIQISDEDGELVKLPEIRPDLMWDAPEPGTKEARELRKTIEEK